MQIDPERIYAALAKLEANIDRVDEKVGEILLHQKEQNGKVDRNMECIAQNAQALERHSRLLMNHGERIVSLERGEEVESSWQREFRDDTKDELDWSRDRIVELIWKVGPWVVVTAMLAERILS